MQTSTKFRMLKCSALILALLWVVAGCGDLFDDEDASNDANGMTGTGGGASTDGGPGGEMTTGGGVPSTAGCTSGIECPGGASCGMAAPCEEGEPNIFAGYALFGAFVGGGSQTPEVATGYQIVSTTASTLLPEQTRRGGSYELHVGLLTR